MCRKLLDAVSGRISSGTALCHRQSPFFCFHRHVYIWNLCYCDKYYKVNECLHLNRAACSPRSHEGSQFNRLTLPAERVRPASTELRLTLCAAVLLAGWASRRLRTGCRLTRSLPGLVTAHSPTRNTAAPCRAAGAPLHPELHPHTRPHISSIYRLLLSDY